MSTKTGNSATQIVFFNLCNYASRKGRYIFDPGTPSKKMKLSFGALTRERKPAMYPTVVPGPNMIVCPLKWSDTSSIR